MILLGTLVREHRAFGGVTLSLIVAAGCHGQGDTRDRAPSGLPTTVTAGAPASPAVPPVDPAIARQLLSAAKAEPQTADPGADLQVPADRHAAMGADPHGVDPPKYDPSMVVSGLVQVAPAVRDHLAACPTLFLMARQAGGDHQLVAVRKMNLTDARLPEPWALDGSMSMMGGGAVFQGPLVISARTDRDGDASSKDPGCLEGTVTGTVTVPQQHVILTLDHILP